MMEDWNESDRLFHQNELSESGFDSGQGAGSDSPRSLLFGWTDEPEMGNWIVGFNAAKRLVFRSPGPIPWGVQYQTSSYSTLLTLMLVEETHPRNKFVRYLFYFLAFQVQLVK